MNETDADTRTVVVERDLPHPPDRVWRALTRPELIADWLGKTDFAPVAGHRFALGFDWGAVDCEVVAVETGRRLTYTWRSGDLDSTVTWTLTPIAPQTDTPAGAAPGATRLRMEQAGFPPGQPRYYGGARAGWPRFFAALEGVLARTA
ncbi:SRPBCC domain-containing protein [Microbaculum marinum]|uniref:SRPBCC domain-containing protein n=1 Tax=Microbaculum marinum TaxID=1764581 RepID=A0AAW9RCL1_9HYPH